KARPLATACGTAGRNHVGQLPEGPRQCLRRPHWATPVSTSSQKGGMTMLRTSMLGLTAALLMGAAPAVLAQELVVYHGWSTPAEVSALGSLRDALAEKGISWKDLAI